MRLTADQVLTIIDTVRGIVGKDAHVSLFGSRLDDTRRGGDVDLLVESSPVAGLMERARIKTKLEQVLRLPVDVVATGRGVPDSTFVSIVRAHAVSLDN